MLRETSITLDAGLNEGAGRTAYLAGFHAAQAMIFERDDRTVKTHNGVHTEFTRSTRTDVDVPAEAAGAIAEAARFIVLVEAKLSSDPA